MTFIKKLHIKYKILAVSLLLVLIGATAIGLTACASQESEPQRKVTLYVYNWGEYISDGSEGSADTNKMFEEWCRREKGVDVTVNYSTYSSKIGRAHV